jgi:hypothetical protein
MAYPYLKSDSIEFLKEHGSNIRFLLDSGAFTAWKAGKEIHIDEYCKFLESLPIKPWRYFTLDVIGNPEGTIKNYETMLARGFKPIPIFTRGEDPEVLEKYYETSDVVGIGGLVQTRGNNGFVKGIMKKVGDRRVHWLGFTVPEFIAYYKPYMCDSSSWAGAVRYGNIKAYSSRGRWVKISKNDFIKRPSEQVRSIFDRYEEDLTRMKNSKEWVNSGVGKNLLETMTCKSWTSFSREVESNFDTKFFLACASGAQMRIMSEAFSFWEKKNEKASRLIRRDGLNHASV